MARDKHTMEERGKMKAEEGHFKRPQLTGNDYTITLDDDPMVAKMIQKALGLKTISFSSAETLTESIDRYQPVAAFVDIHLDADSNGLSIIPALREKWPFCP